MSSADYKSARRPDPDQALTDIADYVGNYVVSSEAAYDTARYCLMDTLGCGLEALEYPACTKLLGPIVPGTIVPQATRPSRTRSSTAARAASSVGNVVSARRASGAMLKLATYGAADS